jgi:UDPglucose 6-dehydrogenase
MKKNTKYAVCIIGPGVVGYATGKVLSENGFKVGFIGRNEEKSQRLKEEGFDSYTFKNFPDHHYDYDITFITVATPTIDRKINLEPVRQAAEFLGELLKYRNKYHLVVVKSTVLPGTTQKLVISTIERITGKKAGQDFGVCMNPEYLREVSALEDSRKPWITLIGQYDKRSGDMLESVYKSFTKDIFRCSLIEAEMQKYVHNLYNAVKITFFNEMRNVAEILGADADRMFKITSYSCEGMWNPKYGIKNAGPFSGHCLPKDTQAFYNFAEKNGIDADLLKTTIDVNHKIMKRLNIKDAHVIGAIL